MIYRPTADVAAIAKIVNATDAGHGEYVHYQPTLEESEIQNYFTPIRLFKLTIQLYTPNNELYDTQNADNSFEFEITMVKNKRLLA